MLRLLDHAAALSCSLPPGEDHDGAFPGQFHTAVDQHGLHRHQQHKHFPSFLASDEREAWEPPPLEEKYPGFVAPLPPPHPLLAQDHDDALHAFPLEDNPNADAAAAATQGPPIERPESNEVLDPGLEAQLNAAQEEHMAKEEQVSNELANKPPVLPAASPYAMPVDENEGLPEDFEITNKGEVRRAPQEPPPYVTQEAGDNSVQEDFEVGLCATLSSIGVQHCPPLV